MYKPLLLVVLSSSLAACAYNQKPVVDMTNVDQRNTNKILPTAKVTQKKSTKQKPLNLKQPMVQ